MSTAKERYEKWKKNEKKTENEIVAKQQSNVADSDSAMRYNAWKQRNAGSVVSSDVSRVRAEYNNILSGSQNFTKEWRSADDRNAYLKYISEKRQSAQKAKQNLDALKGQIGNDDYKALVQMYADIDQSYGSILDGIQSSGDVYSQFKTSSAYEYAKKQAEEQSRLDAMRAEEAKAKLQEISAQKAAFKQENGGRVINNLSKLGAYLGGFTGASQAGLQEAKKKANQNLSALDELDAQEEKYRKVYQQKKSDEELALVDADTIALLDKYLDGASEQDNQFVQGILQSGATNSVLASSQNMKQQQAIRALEEKGIENWAELAEYRRYQRNREIAQEDTKQAQEFTDEHSASAWAAARAANLASGIGLLENIKSLENVTDLGVDVNSPYYLPARSTRDIDTRNMENHDAVVDVPIFGDVDLYDFGYNLASSATDNALRAVAAGGNSAVAGALMGSQVFSQGFLDAKEKGYSDNKAFGMAFTQAAIEGATEKWSLDAILKSPKTFFGGIARGFAAEGSEEIASNWANRVADAFVNGNNAEIKQAYNAYIRDGYSHNQALSAVIVDMVGEDLESGLIGGISGASMSTVVHAPASIRQTIEDKAAGRSLRAQGKVGDLAQNILSENANSESAFSADKTLQKLAKQGENLSSRKAGKMARLAASSTSETALTSTVAEMLADAGMDENAAVSAAPAVLKSIRGEKLSIEQRALLKDSEAAQSVISSLKDTKSAQAVLAKAEEENLFLKAKLYAKPSANTVSTADVQQAKANIDGNTGVKSDKITSIVSSSADGVWYRTNSGEVVRGTAVEFENDGVAQMFADLANLDNVNAANVALVGYSGQNVPMYTAAVQRVVRAASTGQSLHSLLAINRQTVGVLGEQLTKAIYNAAGKTPVMVKNYTKEDLDAVRKTGGVLKNYTQKLTAREDATVRVIDEIGKKYGVAVVVCDTIDGGQSNGFYNEAENVVYIGLDAHGGLYLSALGHELFHHLKAVNPESADELHDFVIDKLKKSEKYDYKAELKKRRKLYGADKSVRYLEEEMVADSMFSVFDSQTVETLVQEHRTLAEKIKDFLEDVLSWIEKTARNWSREAYALSEDEKTLSEIRDKFLSALDETAKTGTGTHSMQNSSEDVHDGEIRKSVKDFSKIESEYNDAVKNNDIETAQKIVDKVAKENGYTIKAYHGTKDTFTVFEQGKDNQYDTGYLGSGFYFTDKKDTAEDYSKWKKGHNDERVINAFLQMKNPLVIEDAKSPHLIAVQKALGLQLTDFGDYLATPNKRISDAITEEAKKQGYDGIVRYADFYDEKTYVVFDSNQIKSADAITYDDNGNVIPLSDRFDSGDNDIRYSQKDSSGKQLSQQQIAYFKDSKVRDENGNLLVVYHGTPDSIDNDRYNAYVNEHFEEVEFDEKFIEKAKEYAGDFYVFNPRRSYAERIDGSGLFFTSNKELANWYAKSGRKPKVYETYLNITNPFFIDANGSKWNEIKSTEIESANRFTYVDYATSKQKSQTSFSTKQIAIYARENGYDGVIIKNVADGDPRNKSLFGDVYVAFNSNQIKLIDNINPTNDEDVRFSLKSAVEETDKLIAVHNMTEDELRKTVSLGGFPMPSIAIMKAKQKHTEYGPVSVLFYKDTIDPQKNSANKVYGGDAWTPNFPTIEIKANSDVENRVREVYYDLAKRFGYDAARPLYEYGNYFEDKLNSVGGEQAAVESLQNNTDLMQLYLLSIGKDKIQPIVKRVAHTVSDDDAALYDRLIQTLGKDAILSVIHTDKSISIFEHKKQYFSQYGEKIKKVYAEYLREQFDFSDAQIENVIGSENRTSLLLKVRSALSYLKNGKTTYTEETDTEATKNAIRKSAEKTNFKHWVADLFKGAEEKQGIRNNKDKYTEDGDQRSFESLHYEITLENVVRAMLEDTQKGGSLLSGLGIFGVSTKEYKSIDDIRSDESRLLTVPPEEYSKIKESFGARFNEIAESIRDKSNQNEFISNSNACEIIVDAVRTCKTRSGMLRYLKEFPHLENVTESTVKDIIELVRDISNMPTEYFEAKPQRAVLFDEVAAVVLPENGTEDLQASLADLGVAVVKYTNGDEDSRHVAVNSVDGVRFSKKRSRYNEYETLVMRWNNSAGTNIGDCKVFSTGKKGVFTLMEASYGGAIELARGIYQEMREEYERAHEQPINTLYEYSENIETEQGRNPWDLQFIGNGRNDGGNGTETSGEGLSTDAAGDDEHLRGRNQGTSAGKENIRKSLKNTVRTQKDILEENRQLRKTVDLLKQEFKLTAGHKLNAAQMETLSKRILRQTHSSYDLKTLTENLTAVFEAVANGNAENPVSFDDTVRAMSDIAMAVLEESSVKNTEAYDTYKDMRDYFRTTPFSLSETAKQEIPDYDAFRKSNFGRMRIADRGISLDSLWGEISAQWPEFFPQDAHEAEQALLISEALEAVRPVYENPYAYDAEEAAYDLAMQMYDAYFDIQEKHTFADKADMRRKMELTKLRNGFDRRISQMRTESKAKYKADLAEVRKTYQDRIRAEKQAKWDKVKEVQQVNAYRRERDRRKRIEQDSKVNLRRRIIKNTKELNSLLVNPTDQKHIPQGLQGAVLEFCKVMTSDTSVFTKARIENLANAYKSIANVQDGVESDLLGSYDADVADMLTELQEAFDDNGGKKRLSELSVSELHIVDTVVQHLKHIVKNENKLFFAHRKATIEQMGNAAIRELNAKGVKKVLSALDIKGLESLKTLLVTQNLKPIYFFKKIGGVMQELYEELQRGEDDAQRSFEKQRAFFVKTAKENDYFTWAKDEKSFVTESGAEFTLTTDQMLAIYATYNREQGRAHLLNGGICFKENTRKFKEKTKIGVSVKYTVKESRSIPLTEKDLANIIGALTEEQRAYADKMVQYLSKDVASLGNDISLSLYGYKKFNEPLYFPIVSNKNYLYTKQTTAQDDTRIKHASFTHKTVQNADNPIVISGFTDVWARHCTDMATYHAFALRLEDFNRVWNYKVRTDETDLSPRDSVKSSIENAFGSEANKYIHTLLIDVNGGATVQTDGTDTMIAKFKRSAVFMSLSVAIQQPSAIARAFAMVDPKYFVQIPQKGTYEEAKQYSAVAALKERGYFDTGMAQSTAQQLVAKEYDGVFQTARNGTFSDAVDALKEKGKGVFTDKKYRDDLMGWLPGKMDEWTWSQIWLAVKAETQAKYGLQGVELLKKTGERFDEVIRYTQVYDSVFSRSGNMRNKGSLYKMATAFMSEPTTSLNMVMDAFSQGRTGNRKYAARAMAALVSSYILNAALVSFVYAGRDDDEDETFLEKYLISFMDNLTQNLNPLNAIPFVRDFWNLVQGYSVERADMSIFKDLVDAFKTMLDDKKSFEEKISVLAGSVGNFFGIPIRNVMRDFSIIGNVKNTLQNGRETTLGGVWNGFLEEHSNGLYGKIKERVGLATENEYEQLYDAIMNGDSKLRQTLWNNLNASGKSDKDIQSGLRSVLKKDTRITEAAQARLNGDSETYAEIVEEFKKRGFAQSTIVGAVNSAETEIKKESGISSAQEEDDSEPEYRVSVYAVSDAVANLDAGDTREAQTIVSDIYDSKKEKYVSEGKSNDEAAKSARSSVKSALTKEYKTRYINGTATERKQIEQSLTEITVDGKPLYDTEDIRDWLN